MSGASSPSLPDEMSANQQAATCNLQSKKKIIPWRTLAGFTLLEVDHRVLADAEPGRGEIGWLGPINLCIDSEVAAEKGLLCPNLKSRLDETRYSFCGTIKGK